MSFVNSSLTTRYNLLPTVFDADQLLKIHDHEKAIKELLAIIRKFSLEVSVGLRLLHKHSLLEPNEVMLEEHVVDNHGFALVTRASLTTRVDGNTVPNSWMLTETGFVPMEYSRAELLNSPDISPATHPQFFEQLGNMISHLGLSSVLGPALEASAFVESFRQDGADSMLEYSALDDRANILRYVDSKTLDMNSMVETNWSASPSKKQTTKSDKAKRKGGKNTTKRCVRYCPYVQNPPVHQGTYIHRSE